jgi:polysaccharide biosynthesis transport protein
MNAIAHSGRMIPATRRRAAALAANDSVDLAGIAHSFWRRKWLIAVLTLGLTAIAGVIIFGITPRYYAESQVVVDDRRVHDVALQDVIPAHIVTDDVVLSEAQIIASRDLAKAVIAKLGLSSDPEFNPAKRPPTFAERVEGDVRARLANFLHWEPEAAAVSPGDTDARIVDTFVSKLSVAPLGRSRVIRIGFDSESPRTAAIVVNTVADMYLEHQLQTKANAAKNATAWIEANLAGLREKTERARAAKEEFRNQAGLLQPDKDVTLTMQQAGVVNQQLAQAQTRAKDAEARLGYAKAAIASGKTDSLSEIVGARQIQVLRQQESVVEQKVADLEASFGPRHPRVVEARAELQNVRGSIRQESDRILAGLTSDVTREKSVVAQLNAMLAGLKDKLGAENLAWQKLTVLDQQLSSDNSIYTNFLDRVKQTSLQETNQHPDAEIVSRADTPQTPYFPRRRPLLALAFITFGVLSTSAVLAFDRRRSGFVALDQVHLALGNRPLGLLPLVKSARERPASLPMESPGGHAASFAEAIRSLHVRLVMSESNRPKVVMFASAMPAEGKTTATLALAALVAQTGRRVLIIDCDSRQPSIHRAFGIERNPGLTDYLQGAPLDQVLEREVAHNIDVIPAGSLVQHPANLLGSAQMRHLISDMSKDYELVLLDSPPVMAVSDALVLGPLVDKTIFIVRWKTTPQSAAERGLRQFSETGANVVGTVLSMVNMETLASHDPSISYYGKIRRYYQAQ